MKNTISFPLIIVIVLVLAYLNSLSNGFVWLDQAEILNKKLIISDVADIKQMFFVDDNNYPGYHRPLYNLMHSLDYYIWKENALGYHISSLIIHIMNALLVYLIAMQVSVRKRIAFFIALIFGLLPCHTATVSLIHSKADLLACLFILLPIYLITKTDFKSKKPPSLGQLLMSCFFILLALLSKEVAIMLPIFILCFSFLLNKYQISIPKPVLIYPALLGFLFILFRFNTINSGSNVDALRFSDRILSFIPVYVNYITHTLSGFELTTNDSIKVWKHINSGIYAFYVFLFLIALGLQYYFSRKNLWIAAGFLWFNLFLIPVSQIIPILHFRADRFVYIPSIGFILAMVFIFLHYYKALNWTRYKKPLLYAFSVLMFVSSFKIWKRNKDFSSDQVMFSQLIKAYPECREAQGFIGNDYLEKGDYEKALIHVKKALKKQSKYYSFVDEKSNYGNLGAILMYQGKFQEALDIFLELRSVKNYNPEVDFNLGICYKKLQDFRKAKTHLEAYLVFKPNNIDAIFNLGAIGVELGDTEMVRKHFKRYLEINPTSEYRKTVEDLLNSIEN